MRLSRSSERLWRGRSTEGAVPHRDRTSIRVVPRRLSFSKKVVCTLATFLLFFLLLEGVLALVGVKPVWNCRDPFVGFEPGAPLFVEQKGRYVTAANKVTFFNEQSFPVR